MIDTKTSTVSNDGQALRIIALPMDDFIAAL